MECDRLTNKQTTKGIVCTYLPVNPAQKFMGKRQQVPPSAYLPFQISDAPRQHTFIWIRKGTRAFQKMIESDPPPTSPRKIKKGNIFATSTILALIISLPAIAVTLILHYVIKTDLILTLSASLVVLFLAMGFSYKISKKLARY